MDSTELAKRATEPKSDAHYTAVLKAFNARFPNVKRPLAHAKRGGGPRPNNQIGPQARWVSSLYNK